MKERLQCQTTLTNGVYTGRILWETRGIKPGCCDHTRVGTYPGVCHAKRTLENLRTMPGNVRTILVII